MHLNLNNTISAAGLTTPALYVEAESALLITFGLGIGSGSKQVTDLIKNAGISSRIGTWSPSNRRLVNINHLIQLLDPQDITVLSRNHPGSVQIPGKTLIQDLIHQGAFPGSGHTGHTSHHP